MRGEEANDFTIVGAGLAGALMACFLGRAGQRVRVYERRSDPRRKGLVGGRSINLALSKRGIHALGQVGLAQFKRLIAEGVACDLRQPNVIRVAPAPLYNTFHEVWAFSQVLCRNA